MPAAAKARSKAPAKGRAKKGAARKRAAPAVSLLSALAEAAWADADTALAQSLADLDEAQNAASVAARADALTMLAQSLGRAARVRGLTRIGLLGARITFDPKRHDLSDTGARKPKTVRVEARGVARGDKILVKPRVGRVRKPRA